MQELIRYWPSAIILLAGIAASIGTFISNKQDSKQKDRIERFGQLNNDLSLKIEDLSKSNNTLNKNIEELSKVNNALTTKINKIVDENLKISKENQKLAFQNTILGEKIIDLSNVIKNLNTGGSSFLNLRHPTITLFDKDVQAQGDRLQLTLTIFNQGEYALDNVKLKAYKLDDYRNADPVVIWSQMSLSGLNIHSRFPGMRLESIVNQSAFNQPLLDCQFAVFKPGQSSLLGPISFIYPFEFFGINIFVESRRQDWIILARFYRPVNWDQPFTFQACRILQVTGRGLKDISTSIDPGFPQTPDGKVLWFKTDLPPDWFANSKSNN